ncbi:hypothetical protein C6361_00925 [Plantactinospora sp. BC1]|uniref:vWA domain-containing protein n=1 Tax=Plantactinospora sp. BC1 TaxID=2108470 RepID=UPI000D151BB9|nr:hypothetical protein [Plantactinospora sp. BC1]AVT28297.1 hypothetical protein C6361_00925 [Plantactinospora sp. BC1]
MSVQLILRSGPVSRFDATERVRDPHVAAVYVTAGGQIDILDGGRPIGLGDQLLLRYRTRYDVDLSDHQRTIELRSSPPPARGGIYHFATMVNVGFRVTDPRQIVSRNIQDGLRVVSDYLMSEFRDITAAFPIEEAKAAEDAINARFRRGVTIGGCIELYMCRARLEPDAAAVAYLQREEEAKRDNVVKAAEHERNADEARRANNIDLIRQSGAIEQRARERDALAGRPFSMQDLLALHLENNPGDTARALEMAADMEARLAVEREKADKRNWEKFEYMAGRNLVEAYDMGQVRDEVVRGASGYPHVALGSAPSTASGWDVPLPEAGDGADRPGNRPPGLIPIYLVIDESPAMAAGIDALNAGLRSLYDTLAADPEVAEVVRLAVLSYADTAAVRIPLSTARPGVRLPAFTVGAGSARLADAFSRLLDCIPRDAAALKEETSSLRRPQVLMLTGDRPAEDQPWADVHRRLSDRASQRYAPDLIACGVGPASAPTVLRIATRPELAFVAPAGDVAEAARRFCAFALRRVVEYGRAVLDGDQNSVVTGPDGFRPAAELLAPPPQGE